MVIIKLKIVNNSVTLLTDIKMLSNKVGKGAQLYQNTLKSS